MIERLQSVAWQLLPEMSVLPAEHVAMDGSHLKMTFDYKLRPGPATSGNALALVRMLGLDHE